MLSHPDLPLLRQMAGAVSQVLTAAPPGSFGDELRMGADGTPTKHVDEIAEKAILELLPAGLDVVSEEAGAIDHGGERVLVVDPVDGTTNAVRGIPFYCVSLAIGKRTLADVEVGLVLNLCTGDIYEGARGEGATRNGRPVRVRPQGKQRVVATSSMRPEETPSRAVLRSFGASALEMALVGAGALDGYHHAKPILRVIDVAAATLIVREAGGVVLDDKGGDLDPPLTLEPRFELTAAATRELALELRGAS